MNTPLNLNIRLEAGESVTLTAVFDPNAHGPDATGPVVRHIYIDTNSISRPQLDFVFQGNVVK